MFKKLLIASVVLAASTSIAFAHANRANYKADYKGDYKDMPVPCPTYTFMAGPYLGASVGVRDNYASNPVFYKGLEGVLSAGYAGILSPMFYLAGEIFVGDSAKISDYRDGAGNGVKTTWNYGLSLIPGWMVNDHVMGYLRLGVQRARFRTQGSSRTGGHLGLGLQTALAQNWDLRGEYVYSSFKSVTGLAGRPRSDQFNLGVVYKFV